MSWPVIWVVIAIVMAVIEAISLGLTTIWFAAGALITVLFALMGIPYYAQIVIFLASSVILLLLTRPIVTKYMHVGTVKTNVDSLIGRECVVVKDITKHKYGQVKLAGQVWTAKSQTEETLLKGQDVSVIAVEGVKLIVERIGG